MNALGVHVFDQGHPDALKEISYAFVVKNPGIPYRAAFVHYFVQKQVPIYTEIEIAYRYAKNFPMRPSPVRMERQRLPHYSMRC